MKTYKLFRYQGVVLGDVILKIENGIQSTVPLIESNRDYKEYQAWLAEGNTPEAADPFEEPS